MRRFTTAAVAAALAWAATAGCEGADNTGSPVGADGGADTGADGDADADADGDADGDADTGADAGPDAGSGVDPGLPSSCAEAALAAGSLGCAFFAVDLENALSRNGGPFAVIVSNPQEETAAVRVMDLRGEGGALRVVPGLEDFLGPGALRAFVVSCAEGCPVGDDDELSGGAGAPSIHVAGTGRRDGSAFFVESDVPVAVWQWNVYGEESASADASLLLPVTSLGAEYVGASWWAGAEIGAYGYTGGEITVVAVEDGTEIEITPSAGVEAAPDASVPGMTAGAPSAPIGMDAFDVVQISGASPDDDLTGTRVVADRPIAVFGSHPCALVPGIEWGACDHVEEQLPPLEAWGTDAVLGRHAPRVGLTAEGDQPVWRIVSGAAGMTVAFDPPAPGVGSSHHFAGQGEVLEFMSPGDHHASGTLDAPPDPDAPGAPFLAYQLMTGRYWVAGGPGYQWGDPMMALAPPTGQYLPLYVFATDDGFDYRFDRVVIIRRAGHGVTLDCLGALPDAAFSAAGASGWEVGRFDLDDMDGVEGCEDGAHRVESDEGFGLIVVSEDAAVALGYPGGTGVRPINPIVE